MASRPSHAATTLGAYASGTRDLMVARGHERATFVGHSLGGGVAMQLAYQFPEHCERRVLVNSGGLGREITPLLRPASLPGSELRAPAAAARQCGASDPLRFVRLLTDFMRTTEPAHVSPARWGDLLRSGTA